MAQMKKYSLYYSSKTSIIYSSCQLEALSAILECQDGLIFSTTVMDSTHSTTELLLAPIGQDTWLCPLRTWGKIGLPTHEHQHLGTKRHSALTGTGYA